MFRKFTMGQWYAKGNKQRGIYRRERMALIYAFVAWNFFGITFYILLKNRTPTDPVERRASLRLLTGAPKNYHIYQVKGLQIRQEFDMTKEELEELETKNEQ